MNSERETLKQYEVLSQIKLSTDDQQEIWAKIAEGMTRAQPTMKPKTRKPWPSVAAAAAAAVVVVGAGFAAFALSHRHLTQSPPSGPTTAAPHAVSNAILAKTAAPGHSGQMVELVDIKGEYKNNTTLGPYHGPNWTGQFKLRLVSPGGQIISEYRLPSFYTVFTSNRIQLHFADYNANGLSDFALGQYVSSNGFAYNIFEIGPKGIQQVPVKNGPFYASVHTYSPTFPLGNPTGVQPTGFQVQQYDNSTASSRIVTYVWRNGQFEPADPSGAAPTGTFNYLDYLPFIPQLPNYTGGAKLTHTQITRYLNTPQNGDAVDYTAVYGAAFSLFEGRQDQVHLAPIAAPKTNITIGSIHATMQKHDGGESIQFVQNHILYLVSTINSGMSLTDLKKVISSIGVPATGIPDVINMSNSGPTAAQELSFHPILPGQFYTPSGYSLSDQVAETDIVKGVKTEAFYMTYRKGQSYITVNQSIDQSLSSTGANFNTNQVYQPTQIQGITVYMQHSNFMQPEAGFEIPRKGIWVTLDTNVSAAEITKIVTSLVASAGQLK
ncbi:hypothetical protein [Alicyclobacillus ferrooxydans]|uniref:Uncharacterized protein n=1 Tax=Alicyclobacillus ferrooxydans TaxID=471514 RepID=A0A0P9F0R9_9BACL|nr:hypothetical protein [Alicyclobacillus ferrooxydans]KPV44945.1 hypothetical protein AN477_04900 [Alicyclobacillus ferrooxydans]